MEEEEVDTSQKCNSNVVTNLSIATQLDKADWVAPISWRQEKHISLSLYDGDTCYNQDKGQRQDHKGASFVTILGLK